MRGGQRAAAARREQQAERARQVQAEASRAHRHLHASEVKRALRPLMADERRRLVDGQRQSVDSRPLASATGDGDDRRASHSSAAATVSAAAQASRLTAAIRESSAPKCAS